MIATIGQPSTAAGIRFYHTAPALPQWLVDAYNLGLNAEERELHRVLCNVHSLTRGQYVNLREEGYGTLNDLRNW